MYNKYLQKPCAISIEEANQCFSEIYEATRNNEDELLREVWTDFVASCCSYARMRAEWFSLTREERIVKDSLRTAAHNKVIDAHTILYRYMEKVGLNTRWKDVLGYQPVDKMPRTRLGDFACYVALFLGLDAR